MFGGSSNLSGGTALERTLDRITVVTAIVWGIAVVLALLEVELTGRVQASAVGTMPRATSEWRNLVDALG